MDGDQNPPAEAYQWYLEEGVKKALTDLAILQRWDWFDKESISGLFFQNGLFEEEPSEEAVEDLFSGRVFRRSCMKHSSRKDWN
jgi:hypothetical protein